MDFLAATLPAGDIGFAPFLFPLAPASAPKALLSFASSGDMRFSRSESNPRRAAFFAARGLAPERVLGLELAHSRNVLCPRDAAEHERLSAQAAGSGGADGIVLAGGSGLVASVTVADCMPIWLYDRASGAYGVLHSGWKGTGILEAGLALLARSFGTEPASVSAILGPAIGACCYRVPPERARAFAAEFGDSAAPTLGGEPRIDLRAANIALARRLGLGALLSVECCTSCEARLGSYRREGPESFTRMVALAGPLAGPALGEAA